jgi:hypothetical protein
MTSTADAANGIQTRPRRAHVTPDVPIIDPREARKGRFVTSRKRWPEFTECVRELEAAMAAKQIDGWTLVATFSTASRCWQAFAIRAVRAAEGGE